MDRLNNNSRNFRKLLLRSCRSILLCSVLFTASTLISVERYLSYFDVQETMDEMFRLHVENKELSPLLVRRSIKLYIQQFDPDKIYLLKKEAQPFLELSNRQVQQVIDGYYQNDYKTFEDLNGVIQGAILRHRRIRKENEEIMLSSNQVENKNISNKQLMNYADSITELKRRNYYHLLEVLKYQGRKKSLKTLSSEIKEKMFQLWERKRVHFEDSYLEGENAPRIAQHYLTLNILKAMSRSLDAHSGYYSPDEAYEIRASLQKQFQGIGVTLREDYDGIFIADLIQGGPAHSTGMIEIGDRLVEIDGNSVETVSFYEVLDQLKGSEGTTAVLGFVREKESSQKSYQVKVRREKIIMSDGRLSFTSEKFGSGIIGKIVMPGFYDNGSSMSLDRDLRSALRALKKEGELLGLVVDIRENSGGFLNQAVKVASMFINGGVIVVSKYSDGEMSYNRDMDGREFYHGPLILLTSKASASASEIIAQAMQDYGVALVVGDDRTYGKGSMQYQTLTNASAKSFFKVTVGRYYTASGKSPQINGVKADIVVPTVFSPYNIGERFLEFPLTNDHLDRGVVTSMHSLKLKSNKNIAAPSVPYLQPRDTDWRKMLGKLKSNSKERLSNDKNFNYFLKVIHGKAPSKSLKTTKKSSLSSNFGKDDLQMKEAVHIIQDMIQIHVK